MCVSGECGCAAVCVCTVWPRCAAGTVCRVCVFEHICVHVCTSLWECVGIFGHLPWFVLLSVYIHVHGCECVHVLLYVATYVKVMSLHMFMFACMCMKVCVGARAGACVVY